MSFDPSAIRFNADNAALLAIASDVAYQTEAEAKKAMAAAGLTRWAWIDIGSLFDDLQAFVAANDEFAVLAFRGSASVQDWMSDLHATPTRFTWLFEGAPDVGEIHAGFGHELRDCWQKIVDTVESIAPRPKASKAGDFDVDSVKAQRTLWITGHSLGGALAVLAGAAFTLLPGGVMRPVSGIYTFGQPRVGLHNFSERYQHLLGSRTFRFVNNKDLVPRVPFRGWDYADAGRMIHFDANGDPQVESSEWRGFLARTFESFGEATEIFTHLKQDAGDHNMGGYRQRVEASRGVMANAKFTGRLS
jgi:triacylglycerol lipase